MDNKEIKKTKSKSTHTRILCYEIIKAINDYNNLETGKYMDKREPKWFQGRKSIRSK